MRRGTPNGASSGSSSGSSASHRLITGGPGGPGSIGCSATLGRVKNLEMTEYQKEKLINEANTVKIKVTAVQNRDHTTFFRLYNCINQLGLTKMATVPFILILWFMLGIQGIHPLAWT